MDDLSRYPIGSLYFSDKNTSPASIYGGTWTKIQGRVLIGAGEIEPDGTIPQTNSTTKIIYQVGNNPNAGLPNITGGIRNQAVFDNSEGYGAFNLTNAQNFYAGSRGYVSKAVDFNANRSSKIYGNSTTVQPNGYVINIWQRTA